MNLYEQWQQDKEKIERLQKTLDACEKSMRWVLPFLHGKPEKRVLDALIKIREVRGEQ